MNEPAVFGPEENTMQKSAGHILGDGTRVLHRDIHNAYGHLMSRATYNGLVARDESNQRPFILTRAGFAGSPQNA